MKGRNSGNTENGFIGRLQRFMGIRLKENRTIRPPLAHRILKQRKEAVADDFAEQANPVRPLPAELQGFF